jgi:intein/homing endonuclease
VEPAEEVIDLNEEVPEDYYNEETGEYFGKVEGFETEDPKDEIEDIWEMDFEDLEANKDRFTEAEYLELLYMNYPSTWMEEFLVNPQEPDKPLKLRYYQYEMLNNNKYKKIARCGRQLGKSASIQMQILYFGLKRKNSKMLIIGPQKTHVEELFDGILEMIGHCPIIKPQITHKRQPMQLVFTLPDGSKNRALFMTTGEESGGKGLSIRGKCQPAGSKIHMADGSLKNIENIQPGDLVVSFDEKSASFTTNTVTDLIDNGIKDVYKITTATGRNTRVTDNHPFYSEDGTWKDITNLTVGDYIAIPRTGEFGTLHLDDATSLFLSYMMGDGTCGTTISHNKYGSETTKIAFSVDNKVIEDEFTRILDFLKFDYNVEIDKRRESLKSIRLSIKGMKDGTNPAINLLKEYGLFGKYAHQKSLGPKLMQMNKRTAGTFINRLFSTDGWGSIDARGNCEIGYCSSSETLIKEIQILLDRFGIVSRIRRKSTTHRDTFILSIRDSVNILKFLQRIGFIYGKSEICGDIQTICNNRKVQNSIGIPSSIVIAEKERLNKKLTRKHTYLYHANTVSIERLKDINTYLESDLLQKYIDGDIIFDRIISIDKTSTEKTYGLTVDNNHTYVTDGIVSHNTANVLFIDEADYINDEVMEKVIIPTTNSYAKPRIWMSSTPTGKRGHFRNTWDAGFYETFHYPSSCAPTWSETKEAELRASCTRLAYTHEYDAEWGDAEGGLFSKKDMKLGTQLSFLSFPGDGAQPEGINRQYSYKDSDEMLDELIRPKCRILGVDWNKATNGTRLVWVDFDDQHNMWLRGKWKIDDQEFTQNIAMAKIRDLHAKYNFDHIMVDRGYGSTQIEDLHLFGLKYPETRLDKIVKAVETDSQIEIDDIANGDTRKTYVKNFAVESLVRFTEQHRVRMPIEDNLATKRKSKDEGYSIFDEMNDYVIDRYTANGRPVYKGRDDHDLDAYMFTLYGYLTEVVKTNKLWDKMPSARPVHISYDKIIKERTGDRSEARPGEKEIKSEKASRVETYVNSGYVKRSINTSNRSRFSGGSKSLISRKLR